MTKQKFLLVIRIVFYFVLLLALLFAFYFKNNTAKFYSKLGDFYYCKDNMERALYYYEKSFAEGNQDFELRSRYVNSIINSPLTIEAQERLVKIIKDEIDDSASREAKYFLHNLKREIHNKYPENYIKQAPYNQKIMHWGKIPITYSFKNTHSVPKEFIEEINNAFNEWERVSSGRIKFSNVSINADIIVDFDNHSKGGATEGVKYVVAYTTPVVSQNVLECMNIKFSVYNPEGKLFTPNQIYNTALHEIFHALGLMGHSYDEKSIMYMTRDSEAIKNDEKVSLDESDKITFNLLYMIKPDITNGDELRYKYVPYLVVGDNEDVVNAKYREAKNYVYHAPSLPGGYIDMAESLAANKEYSKAIKKLEKAYRLTPDHDYETKYIIFYNLAVSYFYSDSYDIALAYLKKAEEIKDNTELHLLYAEIYIKQGNKEKAIEEYEYLAKAKPENLDYVLNLANLYITKRSYIKAHKVLKTFVKNNPQRKSDPKLSQYKFLLF